MATIRAIQDFETMKPIKWNLNIAKTINSVAKSKKTY